jgi:chitinase
MIQSLNGVNILCPVVNSIISRAIGKTPCQQGFGKCETVPKPTCSGRSATNGRRVGYYQASNGKDRRCDVVPPRAINTRGFTHLFFSFVYFHPQTFEIVLTTDPSLFGQFTALKRDGLQTWIAVGGMYRNKHQILR